MQTFETYIWGCTAPVPWKHSRGLWYVIKWGRTALYVQILYTHTYLYVKEHTYIQRTHNCAHTAYHISVYIKRNKIQSNSMCAYIYVHTARTYQCVCMYIYILNVNIYIHTCMYWRRFIHTSEDKGKKISHQTITRFLEHNNRRFFSSRKKK